MICPRCGAGYRRGFTKCADCETELVETPPGSSEARAAFVPGGVADAGRERGGPGDPDEDPFCSFWKGTDARICAELCTVLDEAEIPHKTIHRQEHLFHFGNQIPYEVGVPASLYEKAEEAVKEAFGTDEKTGEDAVPLLPPPREDPRALKLLPVWEGTRMMDCAAICQELKDAKIYYRVAQSRKLAQGKRLEEHYVIGVAEGDYERAKEITGWIELDDDEIRRMEQVSGDVALNADDSQPLETVPFIEEEDWYPEDATALVWTGEPRDWGRAIEGSLRENNIRMRWEIEGGKPKLFVLPEHEAVATRIIHEVLSAKPES